MKQLLRIIHVEDSEADAELIKESLLREGIACEVTRVENRAELIDALSQKECDLVLSDCSFPQFSGFQAQEIVSTFKPQLPFIFVSGTIGEDTAIESLRNGATDYVLKHKLSRLVPAVRRALAETEEQATRRDLERRLRQACRLQAISTLAGGVAQDVNTLLLKIQENAAQLAKEYSPSAPALELIRSLDATAQRGSTLMQKLLAFARKSEAHFALLDLRQYLQETATSLRTLLPSQVELTLQLDADLPPLFADPEHLNRILTNLIFNSRDAMPNGGRITLIAEIVQFDPIPTHLTDLDDVPYLCLKVQDNGKGMDDVTRLRVFEPFFTTKTEESSVGLGLPEVFGLMRIHNGLIDIRSEPKKGTTVSLFFPLPRNSLVGPSQIKKMPPVQMPEAIVPL